MRLKKATHGVTRTPNRGIKSSRRKLNPFDRSGSDPYDFMKFGDSDSDFPGCEDCSHGDDESGDESGDDSGDDTVSHFTILRKIFPNGSNPGYANKQSKNKA